MSHLLSKSSTSVLGRSFESRQRPPPPRNHFKLAIFADLLRRAEVKDSDLGIEKINNYSVHLDHPQHSYLSGRMDIALARPKNVQSDDKTSVAVIPEGLSQLIGDSTENDDWKLEDGMSTSETIEQSTQTAAKQPVDEWGEEGSKILGEQQAVAVHAARKQRVGPFENCDLNSAHLAQLEDLAVAQEASPSSLLQTHLLGGRSEAPNALQVIVFTVQDQTSVTQFAGRQTFDESREFGTTLLSDQQAIAVHTARKRRVIPLESGDMGSAQVSRLEDLAVAQDVAPSSRPQPYLLGGRVRAANALQIFVQKMQEMTSIFVQLPAEWEMARHKLRDLIAGRISALGVPLERVEVVAVQESQPRKPLFSEDTRP